MFEEEEPIQFFKSRVFTYSRDILASIAVIALGFWTFNNFYEQSKTEIVDIKPAIKHSKPLPEYIPSEYEYTTLLEEAEVSVEVARTTSARGEFRLWCGSYRSEDRAAKQTRKMNNLIKTSYTQSGEWFVVRTEYMNGKRTAEKMRHQMRRELGLHTCVILSK